MILTLFVTILIEGGVVLAYSRWRGKQTITLLLTSIFANLLTQPLLWLALILFFRHYWLVLTVMEIAIWFIESLIFYRIRANKLTLKEAMLLSLAINVASFSAGMFLPL